MVASTVMSSSGLCNPTGMRRGDGEISYTLLIAVCDQGVR